MRHKGTLQPTHRDPTRRYITMAPYTNDIISVRWHLRQWSDPRLGSGVNSRSPASVKYCTISRPAIKSCRARKLNEPCTSTRLPGPDAPGARRLYSAGVINQNYGCSGTTSNYQHSPSAASANNLFYLAQSASNLLPFTSSVRWVFTKFSENHVLICFLKPEID